MDAGEPLIAQEGEDATLPKAPSGVPSLNLSPITDARAAAAARESQDQPQIQ